MWRLPAFQYPGFTVTARLLKPNQALRFESLPILRIGTILQADSQEGLELGFQDESDYTTFTGFAGEQFLVPPDEEHAIAVTRSKRRPPSSSWSPSTRPCSSTQ